MQVPLQIDFHGLEPSPALEDAIREKAAKLERFSDRITACRVTVEAPHRHHHRGRHFRVHIQLSMPRKVLTIGTDTPNPAHEDVYVALRDAFRAARRRVEDDERRRRGDVKTHAAKRPSGRRPA